MKILCKLLALVCLFSGLGFSFAQQPSTATVVVYRTHNKFYRAGHPQVRCDGFPVGRIDNGSWWSVEIPAGRRQVTIADDQLGRTIEMAAGQTYYFAVTYHNAAAVKDESLWQIDVVSKDIADRVVAPLKRSEVKFSGLPTGN